ncbi:hypothetical protein BGZ99_003988, partial [Dissophora globulifera]
ISKALRESCSLSTRMMRLVFLKPATSFRVCSTRMSFAGPFSLSLPTNRISLTLGPLQRSQISLNSNLTTSTAGISSASLDL